MTTSEPLDPDLPVGKRIQHFRTKAGMSREALAAQLGKTVRWLKAVESGQIRQPRLPDLVRFAATLGVRDLALLTGAVTGRLPVDAFLTRAHQALPAVQAALGDYALAGHQPPPDLRHLRERIAFAWKARHASPNHRTVLGELLPALLHDAQTAARGYDGPRRAEGQALLAETLVLSTFYLAYQPVASLVWRAKERAMAVAQDSGDTRVIAMAAWSLAHAHRDTGDWDSAHHVTEDALRMLRSRLPGGPAELLGLYGALQFEAAYTAARSGCSGEALHNLDEAERTARRLPAGYHQVMSSFSPSLMVANAVTVHVELRQGGEALRCATAGDFTAIPSIPRRSRHLIEVARAHHLRNDLAASLDCVEAAVATAPETARFNGFARQIVLDGTEASGEVRRRAQRLVEVAGLVA
ncbi:transcriptional regulator with XRE-family HTH domain [Crossiella equi]|uniref:Transcriptional regulator with XRE-family HTH domain n=1 Tax=Crossiella equi TaxID=130796 RepID=A0ABS5A3Q3_9PSEU|nr:helix-turn-helix domain-containing protein [Crossiella equi]MBP2471163.1 transcriptional regulator with XRE-family HTH domain [Crossiella equi]